MSVIFGPATPPGPSAALLPDTVRLPSTTGVSDAMPPQQPSPAVLPEIVDRMTVMLVSALAPPDPSRAMPPPYHAEFPATVESVTVSFPQLARMPPPSCDDIDAWLSSIDEADTEMLP